MMSGKMPDGGGKEATIPTYKPGAAQHQDVRHGTQNRWTFVVYLCPVCMKQMTASGGDHPGCSCHGAQIAAVRFNAVVKPDRALIRSRRIILIDELLKAGEYEAAGVILRKLRESE